MTIDGVQIKDLGPEAPSPSDPLAVLQIPYAKQLKTRTDGELADLLDVASHTIHPNMREYYRPTMCLLRFAAIRLRALDHALKCATAAAKRAKDKLALSNASKPDAPKAEWWNNDADHWRDYADRDDALEDALENAHDGDTVCLEGSAVVERVYGVRLPPGPNDVDEGPRSLWRPSRDALDAAIAATAAEDAALLAGLKAGTVVCRMCYPPGWFVSRVIPYGQTGAGRPVAYEECETCGNPQRNPNPIPPVGEVAA